MFFAGGLIILSTEKFQLHLFFNSWVGNRSIDSFFKWITHLGDGLLITLIGTILLLKNFRTGIFILLSYAISGTITQILKLNFFDEVNRPFFYYSYYNLKLTIVDGVDMHIHNSFPSGHSTAAWALFLGASLLVKQNTWKLTCIILGMLTSVSRVYLSQHFFEDIYCGALIGMVFTIWSYSILYLSPLASKWTFLDKSILHFFQKK